MTSTVKPVVTAQTHDNMIASALLNHIGDQLRRDGSTALVLPILPRIRIQRYDRRDPLRAGDLARVNHDAKLHQRGVDGHLAIGAGTARVDDVDVGLSDGFVDPDNGLAGTVFHTF